MAEKKDSEPTSSDENTKITTNCWTTMEKKKKKTSTYQKRYSTSKDKEETKMRQ